jgi:cysteine desulfurase
MYGPKGIGALYVRRRDPRVRLQPLLDGGGQERGLRGGTLNVPGIVGLGAAAALAGAEMAGEAGRLSALRDRLEAAVVGGVAEARVNGGAADRLPHTTNITFPGVRANDLLAALRDLALSTGSACSSDSDRPSHVLTALGLSAADARSTVRIGIGRFTTNEEIDFAALRLVEAVASLQATPVG